MSNPKKRTLSSESSDPNYVHIKEAFFEELEAQSLDELTAVQRKVNQCIDSFRRRKFENIIRDELKKNNFSLSFIICKLPKLATEKSSDSTTITQVKELKEQDSNDNENDKDDNKDDDKNDDHDSYSVKEISINTELCGSGQGRKCCLDESSVEISYLDDNTHLLIDLQYKNDSNNYPDFSDIVNEHIYTDSMDFDGEVYRGKGSLPAYVHYTKVSTLDNVISLSTKHPEETYYYLAITDEGISVVTFQNGKYIRDCYKNQEWSTPNPCDFEDTILVSTNEEAVKT